MAEGIGALLVRIGADTSDFVSGLNAADKAVGKFSSQLDRRLIDPIAKAAAATSAAAAGMFAFAQSAAQTADELGKLSQKVGVSVEGLSGLKYAADLSDVSLEQLSQGLKQLSKFMVENNIQGVGVEEQLLRIADSFAKAEDGEKKTAAAMAMFGKSGADLIPLLNQGRAGIEELRKEAERLGIVFSSEAAKRAEEFNDNMTRLKSAAKGLHIEIAGPLISAINESAKAMLEAKRAGDSWFDSMIQGFRRLVTGSDADKWSKEFALAHDRMLAAEQNMARLQNLGGAAAAMGLRKARQELDAAKADVERLLAIKPLMVPDPAPATPAARRNGRIDVPGTDKEALRRYEEQIREFGMMEAERYRLQLAVAERAAKEREEAERSAEASRITVMEAQQEREFGLSAAGVERRRILKEFEFKTDQELELKRFEERMNQLQVFTDAELEALGGRHAVIEQMENEHQIRLLEIQSRSIRTRNEFEKAGMMQRAKTIFGELANITAGVSQHNRTLFELNKIAGISMAIVNAYEGISLTMAKYPYPLNIAMAAAHGIAAFAQVNAIRSQTFGGGGGAAPALAGGTAAPPVTPVDSGGGGPSGGGQTTVVNLVGETFGREQIRGLLRELNETLKDGGRLVLG